MHSNIVVIFLFSSQDAAFTSKIRRVFPVIRKTFPKANLFIYSFLKHMSEALTLTHTQEGGRGRDGGRLTEKLMMGTTKPQEHCSPLCHML